ncbi:Na(+)-translocating NADH-quinone reductase subunit C [Bacteroides heparinolyticus]|uniref:Na(+)-translocating NADH-quinone reductase subunit C n=1 Tax=Prevotella heparinolytica TaxID=28113 RepID=UPI0023F1E426|nr:Na(+)-translocating NADH-quinone reductase subunit C [Bacteroides heparinolyticus]MCF0257313.1 Na(+)-translocating NADH-quinone reductase subunit C [Bacteroides heparinolyticus]
MNTNSNSYTIVYASVMVVIVAFLLAFVSSSLRETQNKNVELDTKKQILAALGVKDVKDADAEYNKYIKSDMLMNANGTLTENTGAFATAYEKETKEKNRLHVFVAEVNGETKYVFPVYGAGLWGAIWGYVALNGDKDTVFGVYFSHASETPGLGAEIATPHFQGEFTGKKTLENGEIALGVVKNGKVEKPEYQVDGISGGTITSVGVNDMLKNCLSNYKIFLTSNNKEEE